MYGVNAQTLPVELNRWKDELVVLEFWNPAPECQNCNSAQRFFNQLELKYWGQKVHCVTIDTDVTSDIARQYGVTELPAFVFFRNKTAVHTYIGHNHRDVDYLIQEFKSEMEATGSTDQAAQPTQAARFVRGRRL
ncbi:hypothetical protein TWF694_003425 [Orbilia ellipsospora]|uniref:Thioredoxin domain-containing protein n=1 Tax=Orbilia ellipsospora TaxID=2528407 RepID=A0AAV9WZ09_9PEZI